jgi:Family of unknown function (DUF6152)
MLNSCRRIFAMSVRLPGWLMAASSALLLASVPAVAHHSFAMFDKKKEVTVKGVVKEFQWTNPHSWVQLQVRNEKGEIEEWALEALSPNVLGRMGWKRNSLKAGDAVTVVFHPARDGTHGGHLVNVMLADGTTIGGVQ